MDNLTHSLAGLVVAELALAHHEPSKETRSRAQAAWLTSIVANNAPDLDVAFSGLAESPLGYLLFHRGHTHTLVAAPLMAVVPFAFGVAWERWRASRLGEAAPRRASWPRLALLALVGPLVHLAMDATNNYGVHPFWPFDGRWFFGDTIFIVEPLWWVALAAPFIATPKRWPGRIALAVVPLAAVALAVASSIVPLGPVVLPPFVAVLGALAPSLSFVGTRLERRRRPQLALALGAVVFAAFAAGGSHARERAERALSEAFPTDTLRDLSLAPSPGNPFCWDGLAVEETADAEVRYVRLSASTWPSQISAEGCHLEPPTTSAPREPILARSPVDVRLVDQLVVPIARIEELARRDCRVAAYLHFSRAPFVLEGYGARLLGDARYDRPGASWSQLVLGEDDVAPPRCPPVPGWTPPTASWIALP